MSTEPPVQSRRSLVMILVALFSGEFIAIFDVSVANVLLPTIQGELHAAQTQSFLVVAAYGAVYATMVVASGRLGDAYGFDRVFRTGVVVFGVASLVCAVAPALWRLVVARAVQGLGAALLFPQVLAGVQTVIPRTWRPMATGLFGAILGIGSTLGQLGGAWLGDLGLWGSGWRAAFVVNVPLCAAIWLIARLVLPHPQAHPRRIDLPGVALTATALGLLVLGLTLTGTSAPALAWGLCLAGSLVLGVCLVVWERRLWSRGRDALLGPDLFRSSTFVRGLVLALCFYTTQVPFYVMLTQMAQRGAGLTVIESANLYAILGICFLVSSIVTGRSSRLRMPTVVASSAAVLILTFAGLWLLPPEQMRPTNLVCLLLLGINGLAGGIIAPTIVGFALTDVPGSRAGVASGLVSMAQQIANSAGVALTALILAGQAPYGVHAGFRGTLVLFTVAAVIVGGLVLSFRAASRRTRA